MNRPVVRVLALVFSLLIPRLAPAQEARRLDLKALEKEFAPLPVFTVKGQVIDSEVVVLEEPILEQVHVVYSVRTELKKVVEFYKGKIAVEPKKEGDEELGTEKYIFIRKPRQGEKRVFRVELEKSDGAAGTTITLVRRKVTDEDEKPPEE